MNRTRASVLLSAFLLCAAFPARAGKDNRAPLWDEGSTTLLLTHPQPYEISFLENLIERNLLVIPNLHVLGIYHSEEEESYEEARKLVGKRGLDWIEIKEFNCDLPAAKLFQKNECTPRFKELFDRSDGLILPGGPDLPPGLYGQETSLFTVIETPRRHHFELSLLFHLLGNGKSKDQSPLLDSHPGYLVLGICLGMQSINVATGGTLVQDIPSELYGIKTFEQGLRQKEAQIHRSFAAFLSPGQAVGRGQVHPIRFVGSSEQKQALQPKGNQPVRVVSVHHQALKKLGQGLDILALSLDGRVIEAIRHKTYPGLLGIQFHPENTAQWNPDALYQKTSDATDPNYLETWFRNDPEAQAFNTNLWDYVSRRAKESHEAKTAPPKTEKK